jgi:hypothetical protein
MNSPSENNKRIAKNTMFLYFRSILLLLVGLYTSREVLAQLGVSDFGEALVFCILFLIYLEFLI